MLGILEAQFYEVVGLDIEGVHLLFNHAAVMLLILYPNYFLSTAFIEVHGGGIPIHIYVSVIALHATLESFTAAFCIFNKKLDSYKS